MFQSMTGYGNGKISLKDAEVLCEIKSVNNRFIEFSFRSHSLSNPLEEHVKTQLKKKFLRGSFEVKINDNLKPVHSYSINAASLKNLKSSLHASKNFLDDELRLSDIKDIPGLLHVSTSKRDLSSATKKALTLAMKNLEESRLKEGQKIEKIVSSKISFLQSSHRKISQSASSLLKHRIAGIKSKMLKQKIDLTPDDLAHQLSTVELKHDIAEELERIHFHLESLHKLFKQNSAHGKKMDFILQELFREVNTLSVKIEKPNLKDLALTMKLRVEELREQAQNLE